MRLIDGDALLEAMKKEDKAYPELSTYWSRGSISRTIKQLPTVDAVPVVRCKECKQWCRNSGIAESPNGHCFYHDIETNGYDFCSYGERRSGDADMYSAD